jgi:hypothetical protein
MKFPAAFLALGLAAALLGACTKQPVYLLDSELVAPPSWSPGDRWIFRQVSGTATGVTTTHEIVEVTSAGYVMRITRLNQEMTRYWTRDLSLSHHEVRGQPLNRFEPPAQYFAWPLVTGKTWTQQFAYRDGQRDGQFTNVWRVSQEKEWVDVTGGWFPAIRVDRLGADGQRLESYWYTPAVKYWARHEDSVNGFVDLLLEFRTGTPPA